VVCDREGLLRTRDFIARIPVAEPVLDFAARIVQATHPEQAGAPAATRKFVRYGASPRGLQGLLAAGRVTAARAGRFHVSREDIVAQVLPVLRHRVLLGYEGELQRVKMEEFLGEIVTSLSRE
jgi:MoxR-like ATPase